jgi:hypothetical protein
MGAVDPVQRINGATQALLPSMMNKRRRPGFCESIHVKAW